MLKKRRIKRFLCFALLLALVAAALLPAAGARKEQSKTVRVGWYDSTYNTVDDAGHRSGYAYEYQLKISSYNGWNYEYVSGSWPELMEMLKTGQIDLMSDVSYTPEREETMSFASLPMGTEEYYLFTAPGNEAVSATDTTSLNGKTVGVNRDSIQAEFYAEWEKENKVQANVVELTCSEEESLQKMESGALDALITVDSFMDPTRAVPVFKIGSSDYYFAVSKNRPDLLEELNYAMGKIQDENRYYNLQMYEKHIRKSGANAFLSEKETQWIEKHGPIRVGYQDNYLAFCAQDEKGRLTGVLKDYLNLASNCFSNAHIEFEAVAYPTVKDALEALEKGELDCVFPANLSGYEAEQLGTVITPALLDTEMYAVVRSKDPNIFSKKEKVKVAVNEGNLNYEAFLAEHYPDWEKLYFDDSQACLKAIANGEADCMIISNYRYNNIARLCESYRLTTFSLGIQLEFCFAVEKGQSDLYSLLSRVIGMVPDAAVNSALSQNLTEEAKLSLWDILEDNLALVLGIAALIVLVILILLVQNARAARKSKKLISATETDDLTGLYNRKYFFQYANRRYRYNPNTPMDAVVLNLEQFHFINEIHGRKVGDTVLRVFGSEIRAIAEQTNGIAGRFEADRFDLYCQPQEDYRAIFERLQTALDGIAPSISVRLRMGVMPWQENMEPEELFDRARTACNLARGHYQEHLIIYDDMVSERESFEQRLIHDLRHALDSGEFEVLYQPKYSIQDEPPQLVSTEALVRWHHHELGTIHPGDFIPLFEKNGQIGLLDQYVWEHAAAQVADWRERYGITLPVSVNLSRVDVFDPALEQKLEDVLEKNGLEHAAFKLEITESAYTENADQVIQVVERLRKRGYEVEMDDFGTGYSSLSMLSSMPVDVLKMDMKFIQDIDYDDKNRQLVELIADIAKNLKVPVVAEGVETQAQLELLKRMGFTIVQGYYFSRPLPAQDFEKRFFEEEK